MSIKHILKSFTTIRQGIARVAAIAVAGITLSSVADQTISSDTTLTENVSGKLTVENGASVRIGESITVGSYAINSGTLTVAAGKTVTVGGESNYLGYGDNNIGRLILEEGSKFHDTNYDNKSYVYASYFGSIAEIIVGQNAHLNLDWKYFYPNWNPSNERRDTNKVTVDLYGTFTLGEFETMDWYYESGDNNAPRTWPTNTIINIHDGGKLEARNIHRKTDTAQMLLNFDGGTLKFRWDSTFLPSGSRAPALVLSFANGTTSTLDTDGHTVTMTTDSGKCFIEGSGNMRKSGNGTLNLNACNASDFTGDIYLTGGTLNFPIVADGVARKVYFQGGALAVPENGTFVTVANGGSVEFVSVDGAAIRLISNGNAKLCPAGSVIRCSGTGSPVFEGAFAPGGELSFGSNSNGAFGSSLPAGVAYGKVGSGTDTLIVNGLSDINIHEGKLRTDKFRFWRMVFDDNAGTGNGVQLCELWLYEDPDGDGNATRIEPENRDWTVSSHSTWGNQDENVEKLFDGYTTKFLSFDGFNGNADIIIEFPEPREIRAYQWWTADDCLDPNNGDCRTPTAWHWLASTDGENWIEVARESGFDPTTSSENPEDCATNPYKIAGTWWLDYGKTHLPNPLASSTITIDPGAALLIDKAEAVKVGNVVNNGGAVELTQAGSVLNVGADSTTYLLGGGVTGLGGIEKTGSGTIRANGVNTYTGDTVISEGTYTIVPSQTAAPKFFRFSFTNTEYGNSQFAWLKLCSADGTIQSTGISDCGTVGLAASVLAQGTYSRTTDFAQWGGEGIANIFDASADTKFGGAPNGQIVLRLRDDAAPIAYYDVMSGGDDHQYGRRLTGFTLESSIDGETWQTVSEVNVTDRTCTSKTWYSGTPCGYFVRHVTGTTTDATIPAASTVEVRPGATLAVETAMTISKLRINLDDEKSVLANGNATPGKIEGFTPAPNGRLELVCNDSEILNKIAAREEISIALDFESISETARASLNKWKCTLNGNRCAYRLVPVEGTGNSKLKPMGSFTMYIR